MAFHKILKTIFLGTLILNMGGGIIVAEKKLNHHLDVSVDYNKVNSKIYSENLPHFDNSDAASSYNNATHEALTKFENTNYTLNDVNNYSNNLTNKINPKMVNDKRNLMTNNKNNTQSNIDSSKNKNIAEISKNTDNSKNQMLINISKNNLTNSSIDYKKNANDYLNMLVQEAKAIKISIITSAVVATVLAAGYAAAAVFDFGATLPSAVACLALAATFAATAIGLSFWLSDIEMQISEIQNDNWGQSVINIATICLGAILGFVILCFAIAVSVVWADPEAMACSEETFELDANSNAVMTENPISNTTKIPLLPWAAIIVVIAIIFAFIIVGVTNAISQNNPPTPSWKPEIPINPSEPVTPWTPIDPSKPVIPWTPINPGDQPWTPIDPSKPVTPWTPIDPSKPVIPWTPIDPANKKNNIPFNMISYEVLGVGFGILLAIILLIILFVLFKYVKKSNN